MISRFAILLAGGLIVNLASIDFSQCKLPPLPSTDLKPRLTRLFPYAIVDLPIGFQVESSNGQIDAWGGTIVGPDGKFKIDFSGGMVESLQKKYKKTISCTQEIKGFEFPVQISLARRSGKNIMLAKVFWGQFVATVRSEDEKVYFLQIVQSYRKEMKAVLR